MRAMKFSLEICNNSACRCSVFFGIEKYYGGRAMFVSSFRSRGHKHEDVHMVQGTKINHRVNHLRFVCVCCVCVCVCVLCVCVCVCVCVWKFFIFTVTATVRNFEFYVGNVT